jgi:hypothetical protein
MGASTASEQATVDKAMEWLESSSV